VSPDRKSDGEKYAIYLLVILCYYFTFYNY
jgi:hypothetical protein